MKSTSFFLSVAVVLLLVSLATSCEEEESSPGCVDDSDCAGDELCNVLTMTCMSSATTSRPEGANVLVGSFECRVEGSDPAATGASNVLGNFSGLPIDFKTVAICSRKMLGEEEILNVSLLSVRPVEGRFDVKEVLEFFLVVNPKDVTGSVELGVEFPFNGTPSEGKSLCTMYSHLVDIASQEAIGGPVPAADCNAGSVSIVGNSDLGSSLSGTLSVTFEAQGPAILGAPCTDSCALIAALECITFYEGSEDGMCVAGPCENHDQCKQYFRNGMCVNFGEVALCMPECSSDDSCFPGASCIPDGYCMLDE